MQATWRTICTFLRSSWSYEKNVQHNSFGLIFPTTLDTLSMKKDFLHKYNRNKDTIDFVFLPPLSQILHITKYHQIKLIMSLSILCLW